MIEKHIIQKNEHVRDALKKLDLLASDAILFVADEKNKLIGLLTNELGIKNMHISVNYVGKQIENYFGDGSTAGKIISELKLSK